MDLEYMNWFFWKRTESSRTKKVDNMKKEMQKRDISAFCG